MDEAGRPPDSTPLPFSASEALLGRVVGRRLDVAVVLVVVVVFLVVVVVVVVVVARDAVTESNSNASPSRVSSISMINK